MIVILQDVPVHRVLCKGDTFHLNVSGRDILSQEIQDDVIIDYACIFIFTDDEGFAFGGMAGYFGCRGDLAPEIQNATPFTKLSRTQQYNIERTSDLVVKYV